MLNFNPYNQQEMAKLKVISKVSKPLKVNSDTTVLFTSIASLIQESRQRVVFTVNAELTMLYWNIGLHIKNEILNNKKADYGQKVLLSLSQRLSESFGKGWGVRQLQYCLRTAEFFPEEQITNALRSQLSWTHIRILLGIEDELKRTFYIEICRNERWSSRQLDERISSMLFERTAISKSPRTPYARI